jgi:RNA polymerase sigma-70 factor (ECF subfamily)
VRQPGAPILEREIRELEPVLYRFALRATRDREAARDLTQDALLLAVSDARRFSGRSTLRTWVIGILSHKVLDHFRDRHVPLDGDSEQELLATASPHDVERVVMARQELGRLEQALAQVPARERLALLLTDVEGLPREEVCHALSVTETHLRVILHRGRNRLRRLCERD